MTRRISYFNGEYIPESELKIPFYDAAIIAGEAVFEVTRTFKHQPFHLTDHLHRLMGSLKVLRIDPLMSVAELEEATLATLHRNLPTEEASVDWQIIHNISRGPASGFLAAYHENQQRPSIIISCFPLIPKLARFANCYQSGVDLFVPQQLAIPPELLPTHIKTRGRLHYLLAGLEATELANDAWPILMDPDDHLTEGTAYNFFLVKDGVLFTSPVQDVLVGITRGVILNLAKQLNIPTEETKLTKVMAEQADEIFVTATSFGILHAARFENISVGNAANEKSTNTKATIGPITNQLKAALIAAVGVDFEQQSKEYALRLDDWLACQKSAL